MFHPLRSSSRFALFRSLASSLHSVPCQRPDRFARFRVDGTHERTRRSRDPRVNHSIVRSLIILIHFSNHIEWTRRISGWNSLIKATRWHGCLSTLHKLGSVYGRGRQGRSRRGGDEWRARASLTGSGALWFLGLWTEAVVTIGFSPNAWFPLLVNRLWSGIVSLPSFNQPPTRVDKWRSRTKIRRCKVTKFSRLVLAITTRRFRSGSAMGGQRVWKVGGSLDPCQVTLEVSWLWPPLSWDRHQHLCLMIDYSDPSYCRILYVQNIYSLIRDNILFNLFIIR